MGQADDHPLVLGELVDGPADLVDRPRPLQRWVGDRDLVDRADGRQRIRGAALTAVEVDAHPPADLVQPGRQRALRLERGRAPPRLEEGLLDRVVSSGPAYRWYTSRVASGSRSRKRTAR